MASRTHGKTVIEAIVRSLEAAAKFNSSDVVQPCAVLWADQDSEWLPLIPQLRQLLPQLLTYGEYDLGNRRGPAIWLRSALDGALPDVELPEEATPIVYLPNVGRQDLRAVQECPDSLRPLVELQYRGVCWAQKSGRDWTIEAFLVSKNGGLGLDVSQDAATRKAMQRSAAVLATTSIERLKGKRLEAEDFDRLFSDDPAKDMLRWLSDPQDVRSKYKSGRWAAFRSRCKVNFQFDPDKDGELVGAELLGKREGLWAAVWNRFTESPKLYPGVPDLLRRAKPADLFQQTSPSWPQNNEAEEARLRQALDALENVAQAEGQARILELEKLHAPRRDWVWEKLGQAPLAIALGHIARLVRASPTKLGGASVKEMAELYADRAWQVDSAALSAAAEVTIAKDIRAVSKALDAVYRPWLAFAAERLQMLIKKEPLPCHDDRRFENEFGSSGGMILFADGLRFDVAQQLVSRMRNRGWMTDLSTRWAGLPTVTATAKPAVSPVASKIKGLSVGEDFRPVTAEDERSLTADRFRKLLSANGYQFVDPAETGDPSGHGWTEHGELDSLGHKLKGRLAGEIANQVKHLLERVGELFDAGWREIRIVTDHGWLWLPGELPKVELPKYLTASRWARCAAIKGSSRVEVPTVQWHWNKLECVAVAPGIACFSAGHKYAHGGLSLQECLVPIIRVTAGSDTTLLTAKIVKMSWSGLRCRIEVKCSHTGLRVDLRTSVNDPNSSVGQMRWLDDTGTASVLVSNEELEGTSAVAVVLDAVGQVVEKKSTIIGGDG